MRRDRGLSGAERDLWNRVTASVKPLSRSLKSIPPAKPASGATAAKPKPARPAMSKPASKAQPLPHPGAAVQRSPAKRAKSADLPYEINRSETRRAHRRPDALQGRLDLHGMTQREAHGALLNFLKAQHAAGARCVLVITGKGGPLKTGAEIAHREGRGVLRARFREWLHEPAFRALVAACDTAHQRHGGSGAFYVWLKKKRR